MDEQKHDSKDGSGSGPGPELPDVRQEGETGKAPQRLFTPTGRESFMSEMPQKSRSGRRDDSARKSDPACDMRHLRQTISTRPQSARFALWFAEMQIQLRRLVGKTPVGEQEYVETLRNLWGRISLQEAARPDLLPYLRMQAGLVIEKDISINRVDRLRVCGNAVVPLAAAVAFRTLAARTGISLQLKTEA